MCKHQPLGYLKYIGTRFIINVEIDALCRNYFAVVGNNCQTVLKNNIVCSANILDAKRLYEIIRQSYRVVEAVGGCTSAHKSSAQMNTRSVVDNMGNRIPCRSIAAYLHHLVLRWQEKFSLSSTRFHNSYCRRNRQFFDKSHGSVVQRLDANSFLCLQHRCGAKPPCCIAKYDIGAALRTRCIGVSPQFPALRIQRAYVAHRKGNRLALYCCANRTRQQGAVCQHEKLPIRKAYYAVPFISCRRSPCRRCVDGKGNRTSNCQHCVEFYTPHFPPNRLHNDKRVIGKPTSTQDRAFAERCAAPHYFAFFLPRRHHRAVSRPKWLAPHAHKQRRTVGRQIQPYPSQMACNLVRIQVRRSSSGTVATEYSRYNYYQ